VDFTEPRAIIMALKESKISKQAAASITRHITFTIPETLEIITKLESATSQSIFMAAYKSRLSTTYGIKKLGLFAKGNT
jgi:hypothetical protein